MKTSFALTLAIILTFPASALADDSQGFLKLISGLTCALSLTAAKNSGDRNVVGQAEQICLSSARIAERTAPAKAVSDRDVPGGMTGVTPDGAGYSAAGETPLICEAPAPAVTAAGYTGITEDGAGFTGVVE